MRGYTARDLDQLAWLDELAQRRGVYGFVPAQVRPDRSTLVLSAIEPTLEASSIAQQEVKLLTIRRLTRLALAVQAWRLEHGSVPKSLDVLVGPVLGALPLDPQTGKPFLWFPEGPAVQLSVSWWAGTVPAGTPLLKSASEGPREALMPVPSGEKPPTPAKPAPKS
jgi:hypothetical protein